MSRFFLIKIVLLGLVIILGLKLYGIWTTPVEKILPPQKKTFLNEGKTEIAETKRTIDSYKIIIQKDLFKPSRTGLITDDIKSGLPSSTTPKLFAVLIMDNDRIAILEDPSSKKRKKYRVKDSIGNFIVSEIESNRVILLRGEDKVMVNLREIKTVKPPIKPGTLPQMPGPIPLRPAPRVPQSPEQKQPIPAVPQERIPVQPEMPEEAIPR